MPHAGRCVFVIIEIDLYFYLQTFSLHFIRNKCRFASIFSLQQFTNITFLLKARSEPGSDPELRTEHLLDHMTNG